MEIRKVTFQYGKKEVLKSLSARIEKGRITTILGSNGCGKSTLLNLMTKNLKPLKGGVYLDNKNIRDIKLKDFARKVAIVHQYHRVPNDVTVKQLVAYGRTPHTSFYREKSAEDEEAVDWAMQVTNIFRYKEQAFSTLSGGQQQRGWIAMALAQKTDILLLDEPTTHLDIRYQIQVLNLIKTLNRDFAMTVVMVLHDINQAIHYSDIIIGLKDGRAIVRGSAGEAINRNTLYEIFNVELKMVEEENKKYVLPIAENGQYCIHPV